MLFSSQSSDQLNALSANSLNASSLQTTSAALLSTTSSGLADPIQQSSRLIGAGASLDSVASPGLTSTEIASTSISNINITPICDISDISSILSYFGTEGSSTIDTATNLGSLTGTQSLGDWSGVSMVASDDDYQGTLDANSNFNLSMTGLTADVQFLNSIGTEIVRSADWKTYNEAINASNLAAGDDYIPVYQYSGSS